MHDVVIVSRHPAAVQFIREAAGLPADVPVLVSATAAEVRGAVVYGNLPMRLAAEASLVVAVEFDGEPPRGTEYGLAEMRAAGARLVPYRVHAAAPRSPLGAVHTADDSDGEAIFEIGADGHFLPPGTCAAAGRAAVGAHDAARTDRRADR